MKICFNSLISNLSQSQMVLPNSGRTNLLLSVFCATKFLASSARLRRLPQCQLRNSEHTKSVQGESKDKLTHPKYNHVIVYSTMDNQLKSIKVPLEGHLSLKCFRISD